MERFIALIMMLVLLAAITAYPASLSPHQRKAVTVVCADELTGAEIIKGFLSGTKDSLAPPGSLPWKNAQRNASTACWQLYFWKEFHPGEPRLMNYPQYGLIPPEGTLKPGTEALFINLRWSLTPPGVDSCMIK